MNDDKIRGLERQIAGVCIRCRHAVWLIGRFQCKVGRRHCHSRKVRKWMDEIKRLVKNDGR